VTLNILEVFMTANRDALFEGFLAQQQHASWQGVLTSLVPTIHEVDRNATQIWFAFYPVALATVLQQTTNPKKLIQRLGLQGKFHLKDQIDTSHKFLYGHRYWPTVKKVMLAEIAATTAPTDLAGQIQHIAEKVALEVRVDVSLTLGITAVAMMTVQQVGLAAFRATAGEVKLSAAAARRTPAQILQKRNKDNGQGLLGFLRTVNKQWTVTFDENDSNAFFKLTNSQDLASGSANDQRDYRTADARCIEGPIPVECRSAACGTCWVGILGGAEKLSPVSDRERTRLKYFGYIDTNETQPLIRLACMTPTYGAVSLVIPPWNGVFGREIYEDQLPDELKAQGKAAAE
jgi:ferredoxin